MGLLEDIGGWFSSVTGGQGSGSTQTQQQAQPPQERTAPPQQSNPVTEATQYYNQNYNVTTPGYTQAPQAPYVPSSMIREPTPQSAPVQQVQSAPAQRFDPVQSIQSGFGAISQFGGEIGQKAYLAGASYGTAYSKAVNAQPAQPIQQIQPPSFAVRSTESPIDYAPAPAFNQTPQQAPRGDFGQTFFVSGGGAGDKGQTAIEQAKLMYGETGGAFGLAQVPRSVYENEGFTRKYGFVTSSGGPGALQSGQFSTTPLSPAIFTQESGGKKFAPQANVPAAQELMKSPSAYSRLGAEAYGGFVQPLDNRTLQVGTEMSRYNPSSGNLANLANPTGVNQPKENWETIPWSMEWKGAPNIQRVDLQGRLSQPSAQGLASIGMTPAQNIPVMPFDLGSIKAGASSGNVPMQMSVAPPGVYDAGVAGMPIPFRSRDIGVTPQQPQYEYRTDPLAVVLEGAVYAGDTLTFGMWKPGSELLTKYGQNRNPALDTFNMEMGVVQAQKPANEALGTHITTEQGQLTTFLQGKINEKGEFTGTPEQYSQYQGMLSDVNADVAKYNEFGTKYQNVLTKGFASGAIIPAEGGGYQRNPSNVKEYGAFSDWSAGVGKGIQGMFGLNATPAQFAMYEQSAEFKNLHPVMQFGEGGWKVIATHPEEVVGTGLQFVEMYATFGVAGKGFSLLGPAAGVTPIGVRQTIGSLGSRALASPAVQYGLGTVFVGENIWRATEGFTLPRSQSLSNLGGMSTKFVGGLWLSTGVAESPRLSEGALNLKWNVQETVFKWQQQKAGFENIGVRGGRGIGEGTGATPEPFYGRMNPEVVIRSDATRYAGMEAMFNEGRPLLETTKQVGDIYRSPVFKTTTTRNIDLAGNFMVVGGSQRGEILNFGAPRVQSQKASAMMFPSNELYSQVYLGDQRAGMLQGTESTTSYFKIEQNKMIGGEITRGTFKEVPAQPRTQISTYYTEAGGGFVSTLQKSTGNQFTVDRAFVKDLSQPMIEPTMAEQKPLFRPEELMVAQVRSSQVIKYPDQVSDLGGYGRLMRTRGGKGIVTSEFTNIGIREQYLTSDFNRAAGDFLAEPTSIIGTPYPRAKKYIISPQTKSELVPDWLQKSRYEPIDFGQPIKTTREPFFTPEELARNQVQKNNLDKMGIGTAKPESQTINIERGYEYAKYSEAMFKVQKNPSKSPSSNQITTRLYRGETVESFEQNKGRFFTTDINYAKTYANPETGVISFVDIPSSSLPKYEKLTIKFRDGTFTDYNLPKDISITRQKWKPTEVSGYQEFMRSQTKVEQTPKTETRQRTGILPYSRTTAILGVANPQTLIRKMEQGERQRTGVLPTFDYDLGQKGKTETRQRTGIIPVEDIMKQEKQATDQRQRTGIIPYMPTIQVPQEKPAERKPWEPNPWTPPPPIPGGFLLPGGGGTSSPYGQRGIRSWTETHGIAADFVRVSGGNFRMPRFKGFKKFKFPKF
jgi:hypothetical protein